MAETKAYKLKLAEQKLVVSEDKQLGIIKYGKKNDWPEYLLSLAKGHAEHGAILKGKARYLTGQKLIPSVQNPNIEATLGRINPNESAHQLKRKTDIDQVTFGAFAIKIIPNALGTPLQAYHVEWAKLRLCNDFEHLQYCEDWKDKQAVKATYPIWKPGCKVPAIYVYRRYNPSATKIEAAYPAVEYESCLQDIDTDKRVSTFFNALVRNNFSAGTIVTIYDSGLTQTEKDETVANLTADHAGEENTGTVAFVFTGRDGKGAEVARLTAGDLDKQYQEVGKRNQQKIIMGHNVPPILFKLKTEGQLGQRTEIDLAHELFLNEYVNIEQQHFNEFLSVFVKQKTGIDCQFEVEQVKPVGIDYMSPQVQSVMTKNEIRERLGLPPVADGNAPAEGSVPTGQVNQTMTALTGKQYQNLMRIVRDYDKGRLAKERAISMIMGYSLTKEQALEYLGIADEDGVPVMQSAQKNRDQFFLDLFDKYAHDVEEDEVLEITMSEEASVTDTRNSVMEILKGNPNATDDEIATALGVGKEVVVATLAWLVTKKLMDGARKLTKKAFDRDTGVETEIYTEFRYGLRDDVDGPAIKSTTRDFCREMYRKTRNKALSLSAIEKLSNDFGENAWDYRGGFYNNPKTGETEPWCRHVWKGETKIRKKRK